jgi:hypothetical protein
LAPAAAIARHLTACLPQPTHETSPAANGVVFDSALAQSRATGAPVVHSSGLVDKVDGAAI